jgi:hypothetical protein
VNKNIIKYWLSLFDTNFKGISIPDKIIVIESDDWGSIRVPNSESFNKLIKNGLKLNEYSYTTYDGLETDDDFECLVEVLGNITDLYGNHPVLTANFVTSNPDFEAIKKENYNFYYPESIDKTYKRYSHSDQLIDLVKQAYKEGLVLPQFHGREHVNSEKWLERLRQKDKRFILAFESEMFGLGRNVVPDVNFNIQATYDTENDGYALEGLSEGLKCFEKLFGFSAVSFIANNFVWNNKWHKELKMLGVDHFQGMKYQLLPEREGKLKRERIRRFNGQMNELGQIFTTRNCEFEPSVSNQGFEKTMKDINLAFLLKQSAIISTHRINFTSRLDVNQRNKNLKEFQKLLNAIVKKWPDVIFMSSVDLSKYYRSLSVVE